MDKKTKESNKSNFQNKNKKTNSKNKIITDWFYMTPSEVNAKSIAQLIEAECNTPVDLWEEMNIFQIELSNKVTVDFEPMSIDLKESSDIAFINEHNIKTIFAVYIASGTLDHELKNILKALFNQWKGFLCADSDDFHPIISENCKHFWSIKDS